MLQRVLIAAVVLLAGGISPAAGQPGGQSKGPRFTSGGLTLVWGRMRTSGEVDLADPRRSRYTLQLEGSVEAPADLDAVAVLKRVRLNSVTDAAGAELSGRAAAYSSASHDAFSPLHSQTGPVELPRTDLFQDASKIRRMTVETDVVIARKRSEETLPAAVMDQFKDIGEGLSIRITAVQLGAGRELSVTLSYRRPAAGEAGAFIEKVHALDAAGGVLGGGRWISGNPLSTFGTLTCRFRLAPAGTHQSLRIELVTESELRPVAFDVRMQGLAMLADGETVAAATDDAATDEPVATADDPPPAELDPLAAYLAAQEARKAVVGLRSANYSEVDGLDGLWLAPLEQQQSGGRKVQAVGKLRYLGEEDLSEYDLTLQISYRNRAGRLLGLSEFLISGKALRSDRDYTFRQASELTEPYSVLHTVTVLYIKKTRIPPTRPR